MTDKTEVRVLMGVKGDDGNERTLLIEKETSLWLTVTHRVSGRATTTLSLSEARSLARQLYQLARRIERRRSA